LHDGDLGGGDELRRLDRSPHRARPEARRHSLAFAVVSDLWAGREGSQERGAVRDLLLDELSEFERVGESVL
jgi:hypothetical protein